MNVLGLVTTFWKGTFMRRITITVPEARVANMVKSLLLIWDVVGEYVLDVGDHDYYVKYEDMDIVNKCLDELQASSRESRPGSRLRGRISRCRRSSATRRAAPESP